MAKREFIDEKKFFEDIQIQIPLSIAVKNNLISEQDIVKPYLELLLKEMHSLEEINHADNRYDKGYQHGRASCEAMVMHMIDNLLSEQGDTE